MTVLSTYLQTSGAERVLCVEVRRTNGMTYYLSDRPYATESVDTPADMQFTPVIRELPRLHRDVLEPLDGHGSDSYGSLGLSHNQAAYATSGGSQWFGNLYDDLYAGATITVKMTGPRAMFPYADAIVLFTGIAGRISGDSGGGLTVEVLGKNTQVDTGRYPVGGDFNGDGSITRPYTMGRVYNMTAKQATAGEVAWGFPVLTFWVHSTNQTINDILAVYDNGVALSGGQFTKFLTLGYFTLASTPVGPVTADVEGRKNDATWHDSTSEILDALFGVTTSFDVGLSAEVVGFTSDDANLLLKEVLTKFCIGAGAYWFMSRNGTLTVKVLPVPAAGGAVFDETNLIGEVTFENDEKVIRTVTSLYKPNWTLMSNPASGTPADQKAFIKAPGLYTNGIAAAAPLDESANGPVHSHDSLFALLSNPGVYTANTAIKNLYKNRRRRVRFTVPMQDPPLEIGDNVTVSTHPLTFHATILSVDDNLTGEWPTHTVEAIA